MMRPTEMAAGWKLYLGDSGRQDIACLPFSAGNAKSLVTVVIISSLQGVYITGG